jgi:RNA polymerase sigma-70 factor (ECF subfamily)
MAKRLNRTKAKIAAAQIPYGVPLAHLLAKRTTGVLAVLYLMFNEGYSASLGAELIRASLCDEAIRLTRSLHQLMPAHPKVTGALALMVFQYSRRNARVSPDGSLITLEAQERSRWVQSEIDEGAKLLESALRHQLVGPYQLQAAIAA